MTANPDDARRPRSVDHVFAAFGDNERRVENRPFAGASVTGLFGDCVLDLRKTTGLSDEQAVDVLSLFGDITIVVPREWTVVLDVTSILADVEDRRRPPGAPIPEGTARPCLVVRGTVAFADLTIDD